MHSVAQGNLDAMSFIFERYHLRIYNFLFQMIRDEAVCEDLTQNVFYKVIKYKHSYKGGKFVSWIFKIARNLFSDHYQKQKRTQGFENLETLTDHQEEDVMERTENINHLHKVLNTLNKDDKELITLSKLEGLKYEQIAEITNSTPGAVKTKVHRIIKKVREHYFETL